MRTAWLLPPPTKVLDRIFLGSREDAKELAVANPYEIRTVITLCAEPVEERSSAIRYLHFPIRDDRPIRVAWLNAILTVIEESAAQGGVLVHCGPGVSQAPTTVASFLDRMGFLTFDDALRHVGNLRSVTAPSEVLVQSTARELDNNHSKETEDDRPR